MEPCQSTSGVGYALALRAVALLLLAETAARCLLPGDATGSQLMLERALITLVVATLLLPQPAPAHPVAGRLLLCWSLLSAASLLPGLLWLAGHSWHTGRVFPLAAGTGLLVLLLGSLRLSLALRFRDRRWAARCTLLALLLGLTAPLWTSPLAVLLGAHKWFVDTIVALSPASYLAALADVDYLRGDWLYQHAPYGSLRFDYPDPLRATVVVLALTALLVTLSRFRLPRGRTGGLTTLAPQLLEIKA